MAGNIRWLDYLPVGHPEGISEHLGSSRGNDVSVGVSGDEAHVGANESRDNATLVVVFSNRVHRPEQERVVSDDEVCTRLNRFANSVRDDVHHQTNMGNRVTVVTHHHTGGIPLLRTVTRPQLLDPLPHHRQGER
jgi:hypothetical protein